MASGTIHRSKAEIPTIDVALVVITVGDNSFALDTASSIAVEPQYNEQEAVQLVIKGKLKAQKKAKNTLIGNQITLTDNVFNPDLVVALQGGTIEYGEDKKSIKSYTPPNAGEDAKVDVFTLEAYSAQYNAAGVIVNYEKISYPNCTGQPVALSSEDNTFRAPEYVIDSAPAEGEPPYKIDYVEALPELSEPDWPEAV